MSRLTALFAALMLGTALTVSGCTDPDAPVDDPVDLENELENDLDLDENGGY